MSRPVKMYMHTLFGLPAYFDGKQVQYAHVRHPIKLVGSLRALRTEQKASSAWRSRLKYSAPMRMGYQIVSVPSTTTSVTMDTETSGLGAFNVKFTRKDTTA